MSNTQSFRCRSCGASELRPILNLGRTPLANALLTAEQLDKPEAFYPLELVFCSACILVQITETVPPERLFREYFYLSSFSDTLLQHAERIANQLKTSRRLDADSLVIEIASNDGYLLQHFARAGIPVLGIEPAVNIARIAEAKGIRTLSEFFDEPVAAALRARGEAADVIVGINVLGHVANLNGFVAGIKTLLNVGGIVVIEVPYVKDLIDRVEFDTIYPDHLCHFSLSALDRLFRRHGLVIPDVERLPLHGGSLRIYAIKDNAAGQQLAPPSAVRLLAREKAWGVGEFEF